MGIREKKRVEMKEKEKEEEEEEEKKKKRKKKMMGGGEGAGKAMIALVIGTLVYYHCAYRNSTILSLLSDVFIVLLCSLAILGLLFRQMNIQSVPFFALSFPFPPITFFLRFRVSFLLGFPSIPWSGRYRRRLPMRLWPG